MTLVEAPPGGKWWRGQATAGEGWFPKSHVQFVDRDAERRKAEEGEQRKKVVAECVRESVFLRELQTGSGSHQGSQQLVQ